MLLISSLVFLLLLQSTHPNPFFKFISIRNSLWACFSLNFRPSMFGLRFVSDSDCTGTLRTKGHSGWVKFSRCKLFRYPASTNNCDNLPKRDVFWLDILQNWPTTLVWMLGFHVRCERTTIATTHCTTGALIVTHWHVLLFCFCWEKIKYWFPLHLFVRCGRELLRYSVCSCLGRHRPRKYS